MKTSNCELSENECNLTCHVKCGGISVSHFQFFLSSADFRSCPSYLHTLPSASIIDEEVNDSSIDIQLKGHVDEKDNIILLRAHSNLLLFIHLN